jgi:hypothetical protein
VQHGHVAPLAAQAAAHCAIVCASAQRPRRRIATLCVHSDRGWHGAGSKTEPLYIGRQNISADLARDVSAHVARFDLPGVKFGSRVLHPRGFEFVRSAVASGGWRGLLFANFDTAHKPAVFRTQAFPAPHALCTWGID